MLYLSILTLLAETRHLLLHAAGKLVIINLQRTQHDRRAEASGGLVIRARTDEVMRLLVAKLTLPVPAFVRSDSVVLRHNLQAGKGGARDTLSVTVESIHGRTCVLPLIVSVTFALEGQEEQAAVLQEQPFTAAWQVQPPGPHAIRILLRLHDGVDEEKRSVSTVYIVQSDTDGEKSEQQQTFSFTTQFVAWEAPAAASPQGAEDCGAAEEVPSERLHVAKRSRAK